MQAVSPVILRAMAPNPVGSDDFEWIVIENTSTASASAELLKLKDIEGTVVTYQLTGWLEPQELRVVPRSQSGITLNNTVDGVVLLENGVEIDRSDPYDGLAEGQVWVAFADGEWRAVSEAEYQEMASTRRWSLVVSSPTPSITPSPTVSGQSSVIKSSPSPTTSTEKTSDPPPFSSTERSGEYQRLLKVPVFLATSSASVREQSTELPSPPPLDWEVETGVFMAWKRKALKGTIGVMFGGAVWLTLAISRLITWYNEPSPWDAAS